MDQYLDAEERMLTEISDSNGIVRPQKLSKAELLQLKLIQLFAGAILLIKKLEIEETKTT